MLRIVPPTVPRVGRSDEHSPDGFELHLLLWKEDDARTTLENWRQKHTWLIGQGTDKGL